MWKESIAAYIEGTIPVFFSAHLDRLFKGAEFLPF
jgi:hypothetical protein